ncbi:SulP family inorganic anion transporter [Uliginosibacterium sp. H1]|uniref:SulP family inorganic anion transporter n=1 Tax=Uliginosibacterium sp. H1 TaxID=3114757 RepID=UPI002E16FA8B|nr:SulP family inorganic anion transporter [Uliginosibacterium sp. H1]
MHRFRPKLIESLHGYTREQFGQDVAAGITVGVLALPLAMAFAIASGMSPTAGIWTGIVGGLLISLLGGSRVQIGGPTGAFIPIVYGVVAAHGVDNMLVATMLAGVLLLAMGLARLGNLVRMIPIGVVIGFTNGIAVVIFLSQIRDFLGLQGELPAEFFARMQALGQALHTTHWPTFALGLAAVACILLWERAAKRWRLLARFPSQLVALVLGTLASVLLNLPVETIEARFGGIPQGVPMPGLPAFSITSLGSLLSPALAIALLGAIESLLSARVADTAIDDRHDPNQELVGQGIANLAAPLFGGFAATGAMARTATNVRAGARTPVAGIVHALLLLLIVLVAAPLAGYVPIPVLAAIVVVTAVRMGEWHEFARLKHFSWNYRTVVLSAFVFTVLFDLTIAVEIGMILACLFFIYRMQDLTSVDMRPAADIPGGVPAGVQLVSLRGSLFFGAIARLDAQLDPGRIAGRVLVLDLHEVLNIDTSGVDWLNALRRGLARRGIGLVVCAAGRQVQSLLQRSGFAAQLGGDRLLPDLPAALARAKEDLHVTSD